MGTQEACLVFLATLSLMALLVNQVSVPSVN